VEYENKATFMHGLEQVLRLTKDTDLPVRLKAANALRFLCQTELAHEPLKSVLPHLLESTRYSPPFSLFFSLFFSFYLLFPFLYFSVYFSLMNEIDNDDLVKSLEMIIQCFADHIAPFAIGLIQKLIEVPPPPPNPFYAQTHNEGIAHILQNFHRYAAAGDDDDDGAAAMAATECLGAIEAILDRFLSN
jgi:hypothetical protein